ncbi:MAG: HAD family hydrolase [Clostridia bacterium]|nr:HAD family hydrolase [Clostridia bacterium]
MKYDRIIWDFNGTILDDVETGILSVNKLLSDRGLPTIGSKEHYRSVFCFPIKDYYAKLGFDFEREPYEVIAPLWVEQYMINVKDAPIFSDIRDAIGFFDARGIPQTLLSATELTMLKGQLDDLGLSGAFCEVLGRDDIHAASKEGIAREWRSRHREERTLMIGDTDHDLQVARAIGADCALICRGHQSGAYLETLGTRVYSTVASLIEDIE